MFSINADEEAEAVKVTTKVTISDSLEEHIKRKKEMKKLYIQLPKKSGFGYKINYEPGG